MSFQIVELPSEKEFTLKGNNLFKRGEKAVLLE